MNGLQNVGCKHTGRSTEDLVKNCRKRLSNSITKYVSLLPQSLLLV